MEGFKVRCQTCGMVIYETTVKYNCHKPLTGDMLKLLPLYKDWPCYDGSLACESTPRFLMFCSQCAGYISLDGKLKFADFPDRRVTEVSEKRTMILCDEEIEEVYTFLASNAEKGVCEVISKAVLDAVDMEGIELRKMDPGPMTPEELMEKMEASIK
ncbi:MAG: hypothetical protein KAV87_03340 [Desulfobacteraceae bacterium]|nr:hypothetical protein [Desulfobacteraceae bacterium]